MLVCGRINVFRIDVVTKREKQNDSFRKTGCHNSAKFNYMEQLPVFYTKNFDLKLNIREQQLGNRRSTLTCKKDRSQRNSLFVDCFLSLDRTSYKLNFSVIKLIEQIYRSVNKIHLEVDWNRFRKENEAAKEYYFFGKTGKIC